MRIPTFLLDEVMLAARERAIARRHEILRARPPATTDWSDDLPWAKSLYLRAESWKFVDLFPELAPGELSDAAHGVWSPNGKYVYRKHILPAHTELIIMRGGQKGVVSFDGDVVLPALFEGPVRRDWAPWMSLTPMEIQTLRAGTRLARGHVVVTGLGLGHQLAGVCARRQVERVTLVEISAELVDWLLPRIREAYGITREIDVVIGSAEREVPKLTADIALLDHFAQYGNNGWERDWFARRTPGITRWWAWGAGRVG